MLKNIICSILILFTSLYAHDTFAEQALHEGLPIINAIDEKNVLPRTFRTTSVVRVPGTDLNLMGLEDLNMSGSAQFSELSLRAILNRLGRKRITIVNLRQEDSGYIEPVEGKGAISFSYLMAMPWWTGENPKGNRTTEEIEASEERKMAAISPGSTFTVYGVGDSYAPKDRHEILYKIDMVVKRALTEKQLASELNLGYIRIPDKKFGHMEYQHVDAFVKFVANLPKEEWVHFHCKKGNSRTTLFMVMYDMLRNADKVSAEEIMIRQGPLGLGGADLLHIPEENDWEYAYKKGWRDFLYNFYNYAKENKESHFTTSWSEWAHSHQIFQLPVLKLGSHYKETTSVSLLPEETCSVYSDKTLILNTLNEGKQRLSNFRSTHDIWSGDVPFKKEGLSDYCASGSSQYSKGALAILINQIKKLGKKVVVVDLRHDDHLFVNGLNVSTFETKDVLLNPRNPEQIKQAEEELKKELILQSALELHAIDTKYPKNTFDNRLTLTLKPVEVETPEEVVKNLGADYLLVGCKRFSEASDEDVDRLIAAVRTYPLDTWYHFHCKRGKSRTTFFLTLLDMMRNSDKLSMEEIVQRQGAMGGIDLFDVTAKDPLWTREKESKIQWIIFLARFHEYCKTQKESNFALSWCDWSKLHNSYQPCITHLIKDRGENKND